MKKGRQKAGCYSPSKFVHYGVDGRIRLQNRNFEGFFPGKEVQKTIFGPQWPRLRHKLG